MSRIVLALLGCVAVVVLAGAAHAVNIVTVPVGNAGNAADMRYDPNGFGAVAYEYNIGKYEVTAGQYAEFLNSVAATDTYGLYSQYMDYEAFPIWHGCNIKRAGSSGSYTYSVAADWANRPVNWVSWGDSARFANWLHNGQPTGAQNLTTTEDGAYYLNGATSNAQLLAVNREVDWKWAITSEDEWYKAAYHKNDGVSGNYWDYPTNTDSVPGRDMSEATNPGNNANYWLNGFLIDSPYYRTEVGEFELSDSPYGTFDQGGNLWEWNESILYGSYRGLRGGSFCSYDDYLRASYRDGSYPTYEGDVIGFRVSEVPEPASLALLAFGGLAVMRNRRNR